MADDLAIDMDLLSLKKKKKKKKTPFEFDGSAGGDAPTIDGDEDKEKEEKHVSFSVEEKETKDSGLGDLDLESFGKKKKKSKKKINIQDLEGEEKEEEAPAEPVEEQVQEKVEEEVDLDLDFSKLKKKTKKAKKDVKALLDDVDGSVEGSVSESVPAQEERDYTYDELLDRFYRTLRERNPEMVTGEKKKFTMKPPQIVRVGTKKTSFVNFADICKTLHRSQKHVLDFLLAELGTQGSIDGTNQLIIKGRFSQKQIENVLRRYIKEYVSCKTCRSLDTTLQKDSRLHFLQCEACNSRCSVASIKAGFQAVTSKRAAQRAKEN